MMDLTNMMAPKKMIKQMVEFNKTTYENSFKGIALLQQQTERMTKTMVDQATWLRMKARRRLTAYLMSIKVLMIISKQ